jgi:phosphopantothenoylcysteine decarboxylase/phosphopantothenate--cysteine ligase
VLLGVTGCVAAYKACELVRQLQKAGARVKVVMTEMGAQFVTPATFKALTREEVALAAIDDPSRPIHHISLAQEADVFVIAPATANTLNKLANGIADNLLTTTALATEAPLLVAPAMNVHMWRDATTQEAIGRLRQRGVCVIEPSSGYLACGEVGEGRLASVEDIVEAVRGEMKRAHDLAGRRLLVTAGATREHLDPIRFLSNPSSGATGYAIAEEAARRGAEVVLVSGPTNLPDPFGCVTVRVTSAQEMLAACQRVFYDDAWPLVGQEVDSAPSAAPPPSDAARARPLDAHGAGGSTACARPLDAAVFTAAVADFRPAERLPHKQKKAGLGAETSLRLVANPDILATLGANKGSTFMVGFAAETRDLLAAAAAKLVAKNADLIVANDVSDPALGFASSHNRWHFVSAEGVTTTDILHKKVLARLLLDVVAEAVAGSATAPASGGKVGSAPAQGDGAGQ